jgi:uncharacterized protein (TIGR03086 family)
MQATFNRLDTLLAKFDSEAERFRRIAGRFSDVAAAMSPESWSNPAPPEGWLAVDVVRHLVEWVPSFFSRGGIELPTSTTIDADPAAAWTALCDALQALLDDPGVATSTIDIDPVGPHTVAVAIERFVTADVLVHTWDLASAAGVDVVIDQEMAAQLLAGFTAMADVLVASGQFKPAVPVPDDAAVEVKLIAASGRDPYWR